MDDPREIELAFTVLDRATVEDHHLLRKASEPVCARLTSTYYDSPTHVLGQAGWSVRLRSSGNRWFQTVKGPTVSASRPELEIPVVMQTEQKTLQMDHLRDTPVWRIIGDNPSALTPIFETQIDRTIRYLHTPSGTIESAIDDGSVYDMDRSRRVPIHDLELEKKSGDIGTLFRIAVELAIDTRIKIEDASKAQRGYQLISGVTSQVFKHNDNIPLTKDINTLHTFQCVMVNIITHLRKNLQVAYSGDPNGIHQVRVAIRRARAALGFFHEVLRDSTVKAFDRELRHFAQVFGKARDWDVFITETLVVAAKDLPNANWIDLIHHAALKPQANAHSVVIDVIDGRRFNSLIISLMGWVENHPSLQAASRPARKIVPDLLSTVVGKVAGRRRKLDSTPESFHALRKSVKKLRYAVEFVGNLYPHKDVKAFLEPCKDVQEVLGFMNDEDTTMRLVDMLVAYSPAIAPAAEELSVWLSQRKSKVKTSSSQFAKLIVDRPFWA